MIIGVSSISQPGLNAVQPLAPAQLGPLAASLLLEIDEALDHNVDKARDRLRRLDEIFRLFPVWPGGLPRVETPRGGPRPRGGLAPWQLIRIDTVISRRMDEALYIDELASEVRLSQSHFCRAFKASTGETPHAYIMRRRLDRACVLMLETGESLSQIATACGLADQAHFSRLFRRRFDMTPWQWRREQRNG